MNIVAYQPDLLYMDNDGDLQTNPVPTCRKREVSEDPRMFPTSVGGFDYDARFFGQPCLQINSGVSLSDVVTGSKNLDEIFDHLNLLFFNNQVRIREICWRKNPRIRGAGHVWAHNDLRGKIIISTQLLDEDLPEGFLDYIIYHEMLHSVCPPIRPGGHSLGHHDSFLVAEDLFPEIDLFRRLTKDLSKLVYERTYPVYPLEEIGHEYGLERRHKNFTYEGIHYQIIGIQPSNKTFKVIIQDIDTGEESKTSAEFIIETIDSVSSSSLQALIDELTDDPTIFIPRGKRTFKYKGYLYQVNEDSGYKVASIFLPHDSRRYDLMRFIDDVRSPTMRGLHQMVKDVVNRQRSRGEQYTPSLRGWRYYPTGYRRF